METLVNIDHRLFHLINEGMANPLLDMLCLTWRSSRFLVFVYIVMAVGIYRLYPQHFFKIAIAGALTFLLTDQLSAHVIKAIFHRVRPCNNPDMHARLIADHCGVGLSFVSAHAANSFGIAAFICTVRSRWQNIFLLGTWASLVCFSQVYVGVHYPADVVGGALLGILVGLLTATILKKYFRITEE